MTLLTLLRRNVGFSIASAAIQFITTLVIVYLAGPALYADFTVDFYKLAFIAIVLEIVPSPYAVFQSQREQGLNHDLASFSLVSCVLCVGAWAVLAAFGLFATMSLWMPVYAAYLGLQRYLDIKLQAENRINEYYQLTAAAGAIRLVLILVLLGPARLPTVDVLWGSLAAGSFLSILIWLTRRRAELAPFLRRHHFASLARLYRRRSAYYGYYLNAVLKRLRDSFLPIAASFVFTDRVELARYLLAMRAVEAVVGQLRVAEAILSNFGNRMLLRVGRHRQMLLLAAAAQGGILSLGLVLVHPTGFDPSSIAACVVASFFAYPYVFELGFRSDAYAANLASKVSISLVAYTAALVLTLAAVIEFGLLFAPLLVLAQVLAQSVAALSYKFGKSISAGDEAEA